MNLQLQELAENGADVYAGVCVGGCLRVSARVCVRAHVWGCTQRCFFKTMDVCECVRIRIYALVRVCVFGYGQWCVHVEKTEIMASGY